VSIATDVLTNITSTVATTLGSDYQLLQYVYDVSKNNERTAKQGYGVRPLSASSADGVNRVYTMAHGYEVILTDSLVSGRNDAGLTTSIKTMLDKADEIFKALVSTKVGVSSVLNIFEPAISEPEIFEDKKIVVLRLQFVVLYRSALN
jgi:hypothetical protein